MAKKLKEPSPDRVYSTIVTLNGRFEKKRRTGATYLTVTNPDDPKTYSQIAIEADHITGAGSFARKVEHHRALINLSFPNRPMCWSGSFEDLENELMTPTDEIKDIMIAVEGHVTSLIDFIKINVVEEPQLSCAELASVLALRVGHSVAIGANVQVMRLENSKSE